MIAQTIGDRFEQAAERRLQFDSFQNYAGQLLLQCLFPLWCLHKFSLDTNIRFSGSYSTTPPSFHLRHLFFRCWVTATLLCAGYHFCDACWLAAVRRAATPGVHWLLLSSLVLPNFSCTNPLTRWC